MKNNYLVFKRAAFIIIMLLCDLLIVNGSHSSPKFIPGINGLPLMSGLKLIQERRVVFDTSGGRIIEVFADGKVLPKNILSFYKKTLPQLGWILDTNNNFERDEELLKIEVSYSKTSRSIVRFFIIPIAK